MTIDIPNPLAVAEAEYATAQANALYAARAHTRRGSSRPTQAEIADYRVAVRAVVAAAAAVVTLGGDDPLERI